MSRLLLLLVAALLVCAVCAASAGAKIVTVGSSLKQPFSSSACDAPCTVVPTRFEDTSALTTSPVDGTVIRWRFLQGSPGSQYRLRLVSRLAPATFFGATASAPVTPAGPGLETFPAQIPIQAGQYLGIDLPAGGLIGYYESAATASNYAFIQGPPLGDGETRTLGPSELDDEGELAFNADIQPAPTVSGYSPLGGPINGGTAVTIQGTDLTGATSVTFGGIPAVSYSVGSENQITAITPPFPNPGTYAIRVTTLAGAASPVAAFAVEACTVPNVKGKSLKAAKKRIRKAGCKIGKLKKLNGATAKSGEVRKTNPKAGKNVPPGTKVRITLAP
ncbi:MAG TPA: PASTA domain-containing protein [Solirubrobacterales bacterium]|nr:PASTA domain-containing protein [Solirubrobacterales bacterium]